MALATNKKDIVIIGGGAIGCSTAYFLTRHAHYNPEIHSVTILEATEIAGGASGKAGGLIADWTTPKCLAPLSFKVHSELAERHGGEKLWGYRRVFCAEVDLQAQKDKTSTICSDTTGSDSGVPPALDWIQPASLKSYTEIGSPQNSAQVHPYLYTTNISRLAQEAGACIILRRATVINYTDDKRSAVKSLTYTPKDDATAITTIPATDILLAAGPWTLTLFPRVRLLAPRGHSIVIKPTAPISPYVLFPNITPPPDAPSAWSSGVSPELYPRPADPLFASDTIYSASGDEYDAPLPLGGTRDVVVDERRCSDVWTVLRSVVDAQVSEGEVVTRQACYKPQIRKHEDGEEVGPIVGAVPGVRGLWLATGHDEWACRMRRGRAWWWARWCSRGGRGARIATRWIRGTFWWERKEDEGGRKVSYRS